MRKTLILALATVVVASRQAHAEPPGPAKVGFEEAVRRAMSHNPGTELAATELLRSAALVRQARATWLPSLSANGTYARLDADRVLGDRVIVGANSVSANLTLTVPLVAPKAWVATDRAKDNRRIAELSVVDARRQAAILAGRAYLTIIAQRRVLESSIRARNTAKAHEEFAQTRREGGVGNRLDAVRAAQERAAMESRVQTQTLALTRAQEALGVLLGENGPVDAGEATLPTPPTLAAALSEASLQRSEVVTSREKVDSARRAVRDSYTDYLPLLTGVVQPFYQNPSTLTLPTTGWQAQLLLTIPLYEGGNRYGLKHERDALHEQAKSRLDALIRQARSEVRIAFEAVQRADETLAKAREAEALAHEALELSQLAYRAGSTSNIEVVDAERRSRDAETDTAIAEDGARQARLDLLAAAGRFP